MSYEFDAGEPSTIDTDDVLFSEDWELRALECQSNLDMAVAEMRGVIYDASLSRTEKIDRVNEITEFIDATGKLGMVATTLALASRARTAEFFGIE